MCSKSSAELQHIDVSWDNYFNDSLKAKHEKNMKKEYGEESKLTQEYLTTGKLSSRSTKIKRSDSQKDIKLHLPTN